MILGQPSPKLSPPQNPQMQIWLNNLIEDIFLLGASCSLRCFCRATSVVAPDLVKVAIFGVVKCYLALRSSIFPASNKLILSSQISFGANKKRTAPIKVVLCYSILQWFNAIVRFLVMGRHTSSWHHQFSLFLHRRQVPVGLPLLHW